MTKLKQKGKKSSLPMKAGPEGGVEGMSLREFGKDNITVYATEVNLSRAVPELSDGLKPVQRRILYGASQHSSDGVGTKSAKTVGDILGKYHPHGDAAIYGAIVTMVTSAPVPLMFGSGNWGGLLDNAAAMRYTHCGLTNYGKLFFDPDYFNKEVTQFIPNYDDSELEPVSLPAPLPHILLSGAEGIGVGINSVLPSFTAESVIDVLRRLLQGKNLTREDFAAALKINFRWGGNRVRGKSNKEAWFQMFKDSESTVQFEAQLEVDRPHKRITIKEWPPGLSPDKFVEQVRGLKECKKVNNIRSTIFEIECRNDYNYDQFDKFVEKVQKLTRKNRAFKINVVKRTVAIKDGVVSEQAKMMAMPVPELIMTWLKSRIELEGRSLEYRIKRQNAAIHRSKLMIFASDKLDIIFKGLRQSDTEAYLVKHLKRPIEDVKMILDMQVRQLSRLDADAMGKKLKEQQRFLGQLEDWKAKPKRKVLMDLDKVEQALAADRAAALERSKKKLKVAKGGRKQRASADEE